MDFVFDPSLVLYLPLWKLDGASFMSDDAYGRTCTVTGALWRPNSRAFDGDDYIALPNFLHTYGTGTIMAWVKLSQITGALGILGMYVDTDNRVVLSYQGTGETNQNTFTYSARVGGGWRMGAYTDTWTSTTEWVNVAATFDGTTITTYLNGVAGANTQAGDYWWDDMGTHIDTAIGRVRTSDVPAYSYYFRGQIGEVLIYNRALTPIEMQHNYLATKWRYR